MARSFDGVGNEISRADYITGNTANISFGGWFKADSLADGDCMFCNGVDGGFGQGYVLRVSATPALRLTLPYLVNIDATTTLSTGTWYHGMVTRGASTWNVYLDGTSENSSSTTSPYSLDVNSDTVIAARKNSSGAGVYDAHFDGILAEWAFWDRELSAEEVIALSNGFSPVFFPDSLLFYKPLIRGAEDIIDKGTWTVDGTVVATHPRIIYPTAQQIKRFGSTAAVTTPNISVSDAISVTESVVPTITSLVAVSDTTTVTEAVNFDGIPNPAITDSVAITENLNIVLEDPAVRQVSTTDNVSIAESVNLAVSDIQIATSDSIGVAENIKQLLTAGVVATDSIGISESVTANVPFLVSVTDSVSITENVGLDATLTLGVTDSIGVTESNNVTLDDLAVSTNDSITITDSIVLSTVLSVAVSDTLGITESVGGSFVYLLSVNEQIGVTENVDLALTLQLATTDSISVSESTNSTFGAIGISVSESIAITESFGFKTTPWYSKATKTWQAGDTKNWYTKTSIDWESEV